MTDQLGTEAAARVADVLLAFLQGPRSLGVSALARELGLSKAVVHRILQTLVHRGLLTSDLTTREYHLGPAAAALGARSLRESDLRTVAMPVLRELQQATGETTTVSALVPGGRVYLDQVESTKEIKMTVEIGRRFPLHAGSSSTSMLAFLPDAQQEEVLRTHLEALTARTVVDPEALRERLQRGAPVGRRPVRRRAPGGGRLGRGPGVRGRRVGAGRDLGLRSGRPGRPGRPRAVRPPARRGRRPHLAGHGLARWPSRPSPRWREASR